jgi:hypothetical protein
MKTHVDSSQTYSCDVCGKDFKRADHRKRHQESHDYTITCMSFVQSSVTEHVFSSIKILTTNGAGNRVVVGFLVAFSVVCPLKLLPTHIAGMGL